MLLGGVRLLRSRLAPVASACSSPLAPWSAPGAPVLRAWSRALAKASDVIPLHWRGVQPPPGYMPRAEPITEQHVGGTFLVHSGKEHKRVKVTAQMVMHKFGEFVPTRKRRPPPKKVNSQKKR